MLAPLASAATRMVQLAHQPAERINLVFIRKFLAFGMFDQLQDIFHLCQCLFQGFNNFCHLADGLADGRTIGSDRSNRRRDWLPRDHRRSLQRRAHRCRLTCRRDGCRATRPAAATTATPATAAATGRFPGLRGAIYLGCWFFLGHSGSSMTGRRTKAMANYSQPQFF